MPTAEPRRTYQTLDGLRGVGALLIVMRHVPAFFGPLRAPESFLAVDLFYLISGFVIAHAYGERLKGGASVKDFMITRLIRLYPLYLLGLGLGVVAAAVSIALDPHSFWTPGKIAEAFAVGLLMVPRFPGLDINGTTLDGPIWTLLPELIANLAYALAIRFVTVWRLVLVLIVSGAAVVAAELHYGTLDVGYSLTDQWTALARVSFSFFAGVLIYRLFGRINRKSIALAWAAAAALGVVLALHVPDDWTAAYEIAVVLAGFPALLVVAACFEPDALSGRLFSFVGLASYGVYIVHQPLGNLLVQIVGRIMRIPHGWSGVIFGLVFLAGVVWLSSWLDGHYDAPFRRLLRARFLERRASAAPSPSGP
jgi:peptidoglycan/LPS O-acetylase OafA/YrhL